MGLVEQTVGAPVGEPAAEVPPGVCCFCRSRCRRRRSRRRARAQQAHHFLRRILQVVVHRDDRRPARMRSPAITALCSPKLRRGSRRSRCAWFGGEMLDRHRGSCPGCRRHQHDLQPTLDVEPRRAPPVRDGAAPCRPVRRRRGLECGVPQPSAHARPSEPRTAGWCRPRDRPRRRAPREQRSASPEGADVASTSSRSPGGGSIRGAAGCSSRSPET